MIARAVCIILAMVLIAVAVFRHGSDWAAAAIGLLLVAAIVP